MLYGAVPQMSTNPCALRALRHSWQNRRRLGALTRLGQNSVSGILRQQPSHHRSDGVMRSLPQAVHELPLLAPLAVRQNRADAASTARQVRRDDPGEVPSECFTREPRSRDEAVFTQARQHERTREGRRKLRRLRACHARSVPPRLISAVHRRLIRRVNGAELSNVI